MQANINSEGLDQNLYLLADMGESPVEGEYFDRAILYARAPGEAVEKLRAYLELCNAAAEQEPPADDPDLTPEEASGPIAYDLDAVEVVVLATGVERPDSLHFDADDILLFETAWSDDSEQPDE